MEQILDNTLSLSLMREVQQMAQAGLRSHPWGRVSTKALSQVPIPFQENSQSPATVGGNFLPKQRHFTDVPTKCVYLDKKNEDI